MLITFINCLSDYQNKNWLHGKILISFFSLYFHPFTHTHTHITRARDRTHTQHPQNVTPTYTLKVRSHNTSNIQYAFAVHKKRIYMMLIYVFAWF